MIELLPRWNRESPNPTSEGCILGLLSLTCLGVLLLVILFAPVIATRAQQTDRAKRLGTKLMCVCSCNQSLIACNHVGCQYSHAMLKELDDRVARGDSDDLILQSFVQEYGPKVLAEPPAKGFNWFAWITPVAVPIAAIALLWETVRRWRQRASLAVAGGAPLSPELLARARHESGDTTDGDDG